MRIFTVLMLAGVVALTGCAGGGNQLAGSVQAGLLQNGFTDVDADRLSTSQLARLQSILYGPYSQGEKQRLARSALGGRNTLRGLLFN